MAPKFNKDLLEEDGNGDTPARCYVHQAKLAILDHRATALEEAVHTITERTEPLSSLCQHVNDLSSQVQSFLNIYKTHEAEEQQVIDQANKDKLELIETTTKLKTKTEVLWYIVIVIMLGAILAKLVLPTLLGG